MLKSSGYCPVTPPSESSPLILASASLVLRAQANALAHIAELYESDQAAQEQFFVSLQYMHNAILSHSKIVVSGMGKSFKIADKLVATMNSLGIHSQVLHPSDALHGDLGLLKPTDVLVLITSSGETPELVSLLEHLPSGLVKICLTCSASSTLACASSSILAAPVPEDMLEKSVYGIPAPTTTTTACLAVGDAVCITLAEMLVADAQMRKANFGKWHPGGAIGKDYESANANVPQITTSWADIGILEKPSVDACSEISLLRSCAGRDWLVTSNYTTLVPTKAVAEILVQHHESKSDWPATQKALSEIAFIDIASLPRIPISHCHIPVKESQIYLIMDDNNVTPQGISDLR